MLAMADPYLVHRRNFSLAERPGDEESSALLGDVQERIECDWSRRLVSRWLLAEADAHLHLHRDLGHGSRFEHLSDACQARYLRELLHHANGRMQIFAQVPGFRPTSTNEVDVVPLSDLAEPEPDTPVDTPEPRFELHSDYDRNGTVEAGSGSEYGMRVQTPGALVVPNLDVWDRQLPRSIIGGSRQTLDFFRGVNRAGDRTPVQLEVRVFEATPASGEELLLNCPGPIHARLRINDEHGRALARRSTSDTAGYWVIPRPTAPGTISLSVQANAVPGSPYGRSSLLDRVYQPDHDEESDFVLHLILRDRDGIEHQLDHGYFFVSPHILIDRLATVRQLYVAELPDNEASIEDLRRGLRGTGVPLMRVPTSATGGDGWLQDQYQHTMVQGPDGTWSELLLHLPRYRVNNGRVGTRGNLGNFVDAYFPSANIGVARDLRQRVLIVRDASDNEQPIVGNEIPQLLSTMDEVTDFLRGCQNQLARYRDFEGPHHPQSSRWSAYRDAVEPAGDRVIERIQRDRRLRPAARRRRRDGFQRARDSVLSRFPIGDDTIGVPHRGQTMQLPRGEADALYDRLLQMNDGATYGGNIEPTPPTSDAPLGKIIIGNKDQGESDLLDPDIKRLLAKPGKQPLVEIDTSWLRVGHVDEVIALLPTDQDRGFAVAHASPDLALELLRAARTLHRSGRHPTQPVGGYLPSTTLTGRGRHPLTRMLRTKTWEQRWRSERSGYSVQILDTPKIFHALSNRRHPTQGPAAHLHLREFGNRLQRREQFRHYPGSSGHFPASLTVSEFLRHGASANEQIATTKIEPALAPLQDQLPGARMFPFPVLFDTWEGNIDRAVGAFTPNTVNLQVVGDRLLVPRPYGPRMQVEDALAVAQSVATARDDMQPLLPQLTPATVRRHRLTTLTAWLHPYTGALAHNGIAGHNHSVRTLTSIVPLVWDSFPTETDDQIANRIYRANRGAFTADRRLRAGWHRFEFVDGMVDLFELMIVAVAEHLSLKVRFVDSWYYHLREGGIHCGTNALYHPPSDGLPNVWEVSV